jgi:hypothetical protein
MDGAWFAVDCDTIADAKAVGNARSSKNGSLNLQSRHSSSRVA